MPTREQVLEVLAGIDDPELRRPLTDLDMVRSIDIDNGQVTVAISLTVPECPMKQKIVDDVTNGIGALDAVEGVNVMFDVMTPEQLQKVKEKLGLSTGGALEGSDLAGIAKRFVVVASGKGGVGKSTVTANLASACARLGLKVGVLDADVYGFSIPHMLGVKEKPTALDDKIIPPRVGENLQVISMGFFVEEEQAVIWRGPMLHKAIQQFLTDVAWDNLDLLLLDLPPGTGDVTITIAQALPSSELLIVTTPQLTATSVAGRVALMADQTRMKVMGVIENMAYYDTAAGRDYIFGEGGGKQLADKLRVPFLGEIPLRREIREGSDQGRPAALSGSTEDVELFESLARAIGPKGPR